MVTRGIPESNPKIQLRNLHCWKESVSLKAYYKFVNQIYSSTHQSSYYAMPSCYASYHHHSTSHRLKPHPTKPRSISRLAQHSTKVEPTTHSGSPRSSHNSLSGMLRSNL
ncbi:hypothetical protein GQ457_15G015150 [Hibiscus cannabinus]